MWRRPVNRSLLVGAAASLSVSLAACGGSAASASGAATRRPTAATGVSDTASLQQAARSMQAASGYTFAGVVQVASSQVRVSGEFQAPDRIHEVVTSPNGARAELVLIGSESFVRDAGTGKWRRSTAASTATDPRTAFSVLQQATGVRRSGAHYLFSLPTLATSRLLAGISAAGPGSGEAIVADRAISSLQISVSLAGRPVTVSLQYSAVGTAPPVTAPSGS